MADRICLVCPERWMDFLADGLRAGTTGSGGVVAGHGGCWAVQTARWWTSQMVTAMSSADRAISQPASIHWKVQNRLAGW
jgi:hypothetical protein